MPARRKILIGPNLRKASPHVAFDTDKREIGVSGIRNLREMAFHERQIELRIDREPVEQRLDP